MQSGLGQSVGHGLYKSASPPTPLNMTITAPLTPLASWLRVESRAVAGPLVLSTSG